MNAATRELVASINGVEVGVLRAAADLWSFEYATAWAMSKNGFDVSPSLPRTAGRIVDGAAQRPVQWFFDNLLPEEAARDLLAREARIPAADAFGLLAYYGKESAGAITLDTPGAAAAETGYRLLTDEELHQRILRLPKESLSAGAPKRMSNAGAQHKLALCLRDGELFHPIGNTPSTHILKPDHLDTDLYPNSVANEYFVMRLAQRLGLDVPDVQIRYVPEPVYLIERFDRLVEGAEVRRLHIVDACQLLGLDRTFKYQQSRAETLVRCIDLCANPARSRQDILAWTLFNLLTGNGDAHLKNLSFRVAPDGIQLAPFYDLLSTECYRAEHGNVPRWPDTALSMTIGVAQTFGSVRREDFLQFTDELGASRRSAARLLDELCASIIPVADTLIADFEALQIPMPLIRAGQLRVLRGIRFAIIVDMVRRLA